MYFATPTMGAPGHLTMALVYLKRYPVSEATERIRSGIQRLNEAHGVKMMKDYGYHETIMKNISCKNFYGRLNSIVNIDCDKSRLMSLKT